MTLPNKLDCSTSNRKAFQTFHEQKVPTLQVTLRQSLALIENARFYKDDKSKSADLLNRKVISID